MPKKGFLLVRPDSADMRPLVPLGTVRFRKLIVTQKITAQQIRSSFVNASRSEAAKLTPPREFDTLDWDSVDLLGWRDHKMPLRGYLVVPGPGGLTGIMLRAPEGGAKKRRSVLCEL